MTQPSKSSLPALSLIVARAENGVIGRDGDMPWRLSEDLKRFKSLTSGKPVIMGRNTWESLPRRPLPKRANIVVSRNTALLAERAWQASSIESAIALGRAMAMRDGLDEYFVIGGATLYEAALPYADRLYLTEVMADIEGDTYFPEISASDWTVLEEISVPADEKNTYPTRYCRLERKP